MVCGRETREMSRLATGRPGQVFTPARVEVHIGQGGRPARVQPAPRGDSHGRSRSRRAHRRGRRARPATRLGTGALAVLILVVATCASLITSAYLLALVG